MESEFTGPVKVVPCPAQDVYRKLSDWNNLSQAEGYLPADKIQDFRYDSDSCSFQVNMMGVGRVALRIVDREPFKTVKVKSEASPVPFTLWLQIKEKDFASCYVRLTVHAEIPFMLKGMLSKSLHDGLEKITELLCRLPY